MVDPAALLGTHHAQSLCPETGPSWVRPFLGSDASRYSSVYQRSSGNRPRSPGELAAEESELDVKMELDVKGKMYLHLFPGTRAHAAPSPHLRP
jgi:hypothetical protein